MQIDPREIETRSFRRAWRGFDADEVRAFQREVAAAVVSDDDFRRAGVEVATALRQMHELVTALHDEAAEAASVARREAIIDAESLLAEARRASEQLLAESEAEAGKARFEASVEISQMREEAEADRRAADLRVEEAQEEVDRLVADLARRVEEAVEKEWQARELDVERVERRVSDLHTSEIGVVARLRKIGREIAALVEVPLDGSSESITLPAADQTERSGDGVVLDLTGSGRAHSAFQSGVRRGLRGPK